MKGRLLQESGFYERAAFIEKNKIFESTKAFYQIFLVKAGKGSENITYDIN